MALIVARVQTIPLAKQLAESALGQPVDEWIAARREDGDSWRTIAVALHDATDGKASFTSEAIRRWYVTKAVEVAS